MTVSRPGFLRPVGTLTLGSRLELISDQPAPAQPGEPRLAFTYVEPGTRLQAPAGWTPAGPGRTGVPWPAGSGLTGRCDAMAWMTVTAPGDPGAVVFALDPPGRAYGELQVVGDPAAA